MRPQDWIDRPSRGNTTAPRISSTGPKTGSRPTKTTTITPRTTSKPAPAPRTSGRPTRGPAIIRQPKSGAKTPGTQRDYRFIVTPSKPSVSKSSAGSNPGRGGATGRGGKGGTTWVDIPRSPRTTKSATGKSAPGRNAPGKNAPGLGVGGGKKTPRGPGGAPGDGGFGRTRPKTSVVDRRPGGPVDPPGGGGGGGGRGGGRDRDRGDAGRRGDRDAPYSYGDDYSYDYDRHHRHGHRHHHGHGCGCGSCSGWGFSFGLHWGWGSFWYGHGHRYWRHYNWWPHYSYYPRRVYWYPVYEPYYVYYETPVYDQYYTSAEVYPYDDGYGYGYDYATGGGLTDAGLAAGATTQPDLPLAPSHDEAWSRVRQGRFEDARIIFAELVLANLNDAEARIGYAMSAAFEGEHDVAADKMRRALEIDVDALSRIPSDDTLNGLFASLLDAYAQIVRKDRKDRDGLLMTSVLRYLTGDLGSAHFAAGAAMRAGDTSEGTANLKQLLEDLLYQSL
jgi:hypothetical protein